MDRVERAWDAAAGAISRFVLSRAYFAFCCGAMIASASYAALVSVRHDWPDVRLAATFAYARLGTLYAGPDSGSALCTIYGPLAHLLYWPTTWFDTPNAALIAGTVMTMAMALAPVLWACLDRRITGGADRALGLLLFCFFFFHARSARTLVGIWSIHSDAPVMGLALAACLVGARVPPNGLSLWITAGLTAAAVWTKQTAAPLAVALPLYYWFFSGKGVAMAFITRLAVVGSLLGGAFVAMFGWDRLLFGMFGVTSRQPISVLTLFRLEDAVPSSSVLFVLVAVFLFLAYSKDGSFDMPDWKVWPLLVGAGLAMMPTAAAARMKYAGDLNSFGLPHLLFAVALMIAVLRTSAHADFQGRAQVQRPMRLALALVVGWMAVNSGQEGYRIFRDLQPLERGGSQQAFRYAQAHPGTAYFPWRPLATLMAEGRLYHAGFGLFDRDLAGMSVSDEHFRAGLPDSLEVVAFQYFGQEADRAVMRRLPEFACRADVPELPDWIVFRRCTPGESP